MKETIKKILFASPRVKEDLESLDGFYDNEEGIKDFIEMLISIGKVTDLENFYLMYFSKEAIDILATEERIETLDRDCRKIAMEEQARLGKEKRSFNHAVGVLKRLPRVDGCDDINDVLKVLFPIALEMYYRLREPHVNPDKQTESFRTWRLAQMYDYLKKAGLNNTRAYEVLAKIEEYAPRSTEESVDPEEIRGRLRRRKSPPSNVIKLPRRKKQLHKKKRPL